MRQTAQGRALIACYGLALFFTVFSLRLIQVQVWRHDHYAHQAARVHVTQKVIPARRGTIRDSNGEIVAVDEPLRRVVADGSIMRPGTQEKIASLVATALDLDAATVARKITTDRRYVVLKKEVPEQVADALRTQLEALSLRGIMFEPEARRVYPNGPMLSHVLGFTDASHTGQQGVERAMNEFLQGSDGFRFIERDREGREIVMYRGQERAPRDGADVRLTIDLGLQHIVEEELDAAQTKYRPQAAVVIVMRPHTGEILALANRPCYDPNDLDAASPDALRNNAIISMVEPGSTFKIVTAAGAIEEGLVDLDSTIFCENGRFHYGGRTLHDHHGYGSLSVEDILAKSSNIGAAKLALQLGDQRLYEFVRRFGFGERTGVCLPGEINGLVHPPHRWSKISITRIPMGHEVAATPLQIAAAMCVVANGGRLMMPQIVREIRATDGALLRRFEPVTVRQVISPATATALTRALAKAVSTHGTAALAQVPGFRVAGKTGTAQKVDPKGGYAQGKYIVSFVGFLPVDKPELVCLVLFDDAKTPPGQNYGGLVAAPVFRQIAEKAVRYLNLEPQPDEPPPGKVVLTQARPEED